MILPGKKEPSLWRRALLSIIFSALFFTCPSALYCSEPQVKIGILAKRGAEQCLEQWSPMADYLTGRLSGHSFRIVPLGFGQIDEAVKEARVDFVLANPAIYIELEELYGVSRIATMENLIQGAGHTLFGGVIFCRADRDDIKGLKDLRGRSFMAVDETSFGGWIAAWRELRKSGLKPRRDFSRLEFGGTHDAVVYAVRDGKVDAGTVRTDILERMAMEGKIALADFRVIYEHAPAECPANLYEDFPFLHSTRLYPEWPLAKLARTPRGLAKAVAMALFTMPLESGAARSARIAGWSTPLHYEPVRQCLRELGIGPYRDFERLTIGNVFRKYWYGLLLALAVLVLLAGVTAYVSRLNRRLNRSRTELEKTQEELEDRVNRRTADLRRLNEELSQEVAERKAAEKERLATLQLQQNTLDTIPSSLLILDSDLNILMANRHCLRDRNQSCGELFDRNIAEVIPSALLEEHSLLERIRVVAAGEAEDALQMVRYVSPEGEEKCMDIRIRSFRETGESGDGAIRVLMVIDDVTEQYRLEQQVRQTDRLQSVGKLAGGVAHDFNNILTSIIGYTELCLDQAEANPRLREDLQVVMDQAKRAADLTRQLLAFSRRQTLEPQVININALMENLSKMLRRLIGEDIDLNFMPAPDLGRVKADPGQMEQVIVNLAVNARDAMPDGGALTVKTANVELDEAYASQHVGVIPGSYVMLSVTDTGLGMDETTRLQIFEPFFTTKGIGEGTGLGLSTVYGVIKQHGGNIWVYSEPGHGTTFKIYLPRVREDLSLLSHGAGDDEIPGGTETILLVEDEEAVLEVTKRSLDGLGYRVISASDPRQAEELFASRGDEVDLLVTDVVMPVCSGRELYEKLRQKRPSLKVLYMSGYTDNTMVQKGILKSGSSFVEKPFEVRRIAEKIRTLLDEEER